MDLAALRKRRVRVWIQNMASSSPQTQRFKEPHEFFTHLPPSLLYNCVGAAVNTEVQNNPNTGKRENSPFLQLFLLCCVC